jgi:hypothetical protein
MEDLFVPLFSLRNETFGAIVHRPLSIVSVLPSGELSSSSIVLPV